MTIGDRRNTLWFAVDESRERYLAAGRADPFVMAMLPMAMQKGGMLRCDDPMSAQLHYQLSHILIPTLASVGGIYKPLAVEATVTTETGPSAGAVGTGFSGGVDSLYTVMTHGPDSEYPLTHLCVFNCSNFQIHGASFREEFQKNCRVAEDAPVVLKVEHLNAGRMVKDVSFELRKGEILGFAGLMGAGRTETLRAVFGADKKDSGDIFLNGKKIEIKTPEDAVKAGIGYLSEDRKRYGVVLQKTITENSTLACLDQYVKGIFIDGRKERKVTKKYVDLLKTKTPGIDQLVMNLSGGNQQKVVVAKWLVNNCDILIFDEPTRGIDVGAKQEIYELMNQLVKEGKSIIMISSEMAEILRMSDRIVVMCEGKKTGEMDIAGVTQEKIMHLATMRE